MTEQGEGKKNYETALQERSEIPVIGMKISTNIERGAVDCSMLWIVDFAGRMSEIKTSGYGEGYGVAMVQHIKALKLNENISFEYWATLPVKNDAVPPQGMGKYLIPAGLYLECLIHSLEDAMPVRYFIQDEWLPAHKDYRADLSRPCYERYPADYSETGQFSIYIPVDKIF